MKLSIVTGQHTYQLKPTQKEPARVAADKNAQTTRNDYLKVDQKGIALLESEFQQSERQAIYDQPTFKTGNAIAAYRSIANEERRNEIKALVGVSLYA